MCYGTKNHIEAIKKYGITKYHRKTFGFEKFYIIINYTKEYVLKQFFLGNTGVVRVFYPKKVKCFDPDFRSTIGTEILKLKKWLMM